jgi:hypothetical protein
MKAKVGYQDYKIFFFYLIIHSPKTSSLTPPPSPISTSPPI